MNIDRNLSSTQLVRLVGIVLGLGLAAFIGSAVGNQDMQKVTTILGFCALAGVILFLGKDYWMLVPFSLGARFPALPLGGRALEFPETAIAICTIVYWIHLATRKEKWPTFRAATTPFVLFMGWVVFIFCLYPVGLAFLGAGVGGARFYIKLVLAFASFFILYNRIYSERDLRWIIGLMIFGTVFSVVYGAAEFVLAGPTVDQSTGMVVEEFYTWHQLLSFPAITLAFLIFARWSPREVFGVQRPLVIAGYAFCIFIAMLSGKRMGLTAVLLAPAVSAVVHKQFIYLVLAALMVGGSMGFLVVGQGQWFNLPLTAQRSLSWLPGDWDPELDAIKGGTDEWREALRYLAAEQIKRDPIIGRGFSINMSETMASISRQELGGGMEIQVAAYALGRSWHNTWLGYAADFGIPLSIIQAALMLTMLVVSLRAYKFFGRRTAAGVFCMYVFIFTVRDVIASHTSGHTSFDAFDRWWMYGIVIALYYQAMAEKASAPTPKASKPAIAPKAAPAPAPTPA